nr:hypothetical protein [Brevundimonas diminuta]
MSFPQVRENLQAAIFARLGEDAFYDDRPEPVRVRLAEGDETAGFGDGGRLILGAMTMRVRRSEVSSPAEGQGFRLTNGRRFTIFADPLLDRNGVWLCPVTETIE